jgi:hypothetical protein
MSWRASGQSEGALAPFLSRELYGLSFGRCLRRCLSTPPSRRGHRRPYRQTGRPIVCAGKPGHAIAALLALISLAALTWTHAKETSPDDKGPPNTQRWFGVRFMEDVRVPARMHSFLPLALAERSAPRSPPRTARSPACRIRRRPALSWAREAGLLSCIRGSPACHLLPPISDAAIQSPALRGSQPAATGYVRRVRGLRPRVTSSGENHPAGAPAAVVSRSQAPGL